MTDKAIYRPSYFQSDGDCHKHDDYHCEECLEESRNAGRQLALVIADNSMGSVDKSDALEQFKKQTKFIKKALDMSDQGLAKKRVAEIPELMAKAQEKITIGKMGELLEDEYIPTGVIRSFYNFIYRLGRRRR